MDDIIIDLYQNAEIRHTKGLATEARRRTREAESDIADLSRRAETLALACQALWELLRETNGFRDEQLVNKILEIDLRDGKRDGKISKRPVSCPECGRANSSTQRKCFYCGTPIPGDIFEKK